MVYRILRIQLAAIGIFCAFISARVDTLPVHVPPSPALIVNRNTTLHLKPLFRVVWHHMLFSLFLFCV